MEHMGNIQKNSDNIQAGLQEASFSIWLSVHACRDRKVQSKDCLLRCEQDGENLDMILYDKSRVYIKTHDQNYHCFYQAVLTSLHQYIKHLEGFNKYTAVHLKYQMLLHLLNNIQNTKLMKKIFGLKLYFSKHVLKLGYSSSYKLSNGGMPNPC